MIPNPRGFRDEGLVARAIKGYARNVAPQDFFNGADDKPVNDIAKASTITAIRLLADREFGKDNMQSTLDGPLNAAIEATTKGALRAAIDGAYALLPAEPAAAA